MEHIALYRKYRPKVFEDVLAQGHVTSTLINQIHANRISHAYLFNGPRGTGKTTCAKILSRVVNCLNPQGHNPCNECEHCKQILQDSFLDVIEMDAASHNGVDDIRELVDGVRYPPSTGRKKVIIIDEAHMITKGAFNALLKTIEEPPSYMIFIFATTEPNKIPQTIISRCQRFDFKRIDGEEMTNYLKQISEKEGILIEDAALAKIAKQADGAMRDALGILEKAASAECPKIGEAELDEILGTSFEDAETLIEALLQADIRKVLELSTKMYLEGKDLNLVREELIELIRKSLLYAAGLPANVSGLKHREERFLQRIEAKGKQAFFLFALSQFIESSKNKSFANLRAEFEYALAAICSKPDLKKKGALESKVIELEERIKVLEEGARPAAAGCAQGAPHREAQAGRSDAYFEAMFDSLDDDFFDGYEDASASGAVRKTPAASGRERLSPAPGAPVRKPAGEGGAAALRANPDSGTERALRDSVAGHAAAEEASAERARQDLSEERVREPEAVRAPKAPPKAESKDSFKIAGHRWDEVLAAVKQKNPYAYTVICKLNPISFDGSLFRAGFPSNLKALAMGFESRGLSDILKDSVRELCGVEITISII
ncbi:MAG: DNA polymerase III subunit gamma/tau [Bacillota bacterium]|nr:DNA polymerase III subunit gamma/tau [Bacillota bacterium]